MNVDPQRPPTGGTERHFGGTDWIVALLAALASPFLHGYQFGWENHRMQVPYLRSLQDGSLFPGDPLIEAMQSYFGVFWPSLAWLAERLPVEPLFLGLHLAFALAKFALVLAIGRRLFPEDARAALLGVWLVFWGRSAIGSESINWIYLAHTPAAYVPGLAALLAALGGRWKVSLFLAGLTFNVHAMQAGYVLLMVVTAFLFDPRKSWRDFALGLGAFALAAAPGIQSMLGSSVLGAPDDLAELVRAYFPYHYFFSAFGVGQWVTLFGLVGLFGVSRLYLPSTLPVKRALGMSVAIFTFWSAGGTLSELWPHPFLLKLHIFRSSAYLCFVLFPLAGGLLSGLSVRLARHGIPPQLGLAVIFTVPLFGSNRYLTGTSPLVLAPLVIVAGATWIAWRDRGRTRALGAITALLAALVLFGHVVLERVRWTRALPHQRDAWHEVQGWARDHTQPADRFLTPPYLEGFRIYSERPIVGESFDGAAVLWSASYADYWRKWYVDMGGRFDGERISCWDRLAREWFRMDQERIEGLAREYEADYIVLREPKPRERGRGWKIEWTGEPLFDNGVFRVYATNPVPEDR